MFPIAAMYYFGHPDFYNQYVRHVRTLHIELLLMVAQLLAKGGGTAKNTT
jgi:hypothetical protein